MTSRSARLSLIGVLLPILAGCGQDVVSRPSSSPATTPQSIGTSLLFDPYDPNDLIVVLNAGEEPGPVSTDHNLTVTSSLGDGVSYRVQIQPGQDLVTKEAEVAGDTRVMQVSRNFQADNAESRQSSMAFDEGFLDVQQFYNQTALTDLGLDRAHQLATGRNIKVAILDTGARLDHQVLAGRIDPASWDFVDNDADPSDLPDGIDNDADGLIDEATGHGTHVAGLVSLVAPDARLMILRVLNSDGRGDAFTIARAIEYAADHGANVINMSLGMLEEPWSLDQALSYASRRGCIFVGSAGNWGAESPEEYPSSASEVWSVAACDAQGRAATFTSFSSHVALTAPGTQIRSAYWNGGYATWSGTSMSAPLVAGTAALLLEIHPAWGSTEALNRIRATALPVTPLNSEQIGHLGSGRLSVVMALAPDFPGATGGTPDGEMVRPIRRR